MYVHPASLVLFKKTVGEFILATSPGK